MKRRLVILAIALFLVGIPYVAWTLAGLPPVRFVLRYGLSPACEPTGETMTIEGVEFVEIGPGIFRMGSTHLAEGGDWLGKICEPFGLPCGKHPERSNEMPVHWVEFRHGFWIAKTEVTNVQFERRPVYHSRNLFSRGDQHPVDLISWDEANAYCRWFAKETGLPIRLPSEAEWECACRSGNRQEFSFGGEHADLARYGWFGENSGSKAHEVATKLANEWGLYDMYGNVWELCGDRWDKGYRRWSAGYEGAPADGTAWNRGSAPDDYLYVAARGGCWGSPADDCRSAARGFEKTNRPLLAVGFRLAFTRRVEE